MTLVKSLIFLLLFGFGLSLQAAEKAYTDEIRYLHVQKGQTLHNIVKRLYPLRTKEWPSITKDIVELNPHAFINNNPTRMKAGVRLTLPGKAVAQTAKPVVTAKKVGVVESINGSVVAVNRHKISRKLLKGQPVYLGDKVITGEDGFVRLQMIDDAVIDLRCFSILVIEDYALNKANRRSILNLLQGSLRKVTGKIGKLTEDVYELKTPVASVGVRGTEYSLRVFQSKGCGGTIDAGDGLYLEVIKGLVDVHNAAGDTVAAKGETVYVPLPEVAPKKIAVKAGVIKPVVIKPAVNKPVPPVTVEEETSVWWWLLGAVAIALLI